MTQTANIDFETYSEAGYVATPDGWSCLPGASQGKKGLPIVGASVYVEHPTFEVFTMSYDLNDGHGVRRWKPGDMPPVALFAHIRDGGLVSGWNSGGFEVKVWSWCVSRLSWPPVPRAQWRDAMAAARAHSLPGALAKAAEVVGCAQQKDARGKQLITKFCTPRNPTKNDPRRRIRPEDEPGAAEELYAYCDQDVRTEQDVGRHVPDLSAGELAVWQCDRDINDRGVQIDVAGVENCIAIINQAHARYNAELFTLTGGTVSRASELQKLMGWLGAQEVHTVSLDEEHLDDLLAQDGLPPNARRALEIRAAIGSASVKKVFAMKHQVSSDGRLHDLFTYHGARTGRCIAEGERVLTRDREGRVKEVPIERVTTEQEVWDGSEWVNHGGVVPKGMQDVITWDGITATPDHAVFTSTNEYAKLSEVMEKRLQIFRGEKKCPFTFKSKKKRHSIECRERAKKQWANRTESERLSVSKKIAESVKNLHTDPEYHEKFLKVAAKGRAVMDRKVQGAAASGGLKRFWEEIKKDPVKYAEYIASRNSSLKETLLSKGFKWKK